jgi:hypothetical protein
MIEYSKYNSSEWDLYFKNQPEFYSFELKNDKAVWHGPFIDTHDILKNTRRKMLDYQMSTLN